jgi:hypothetical protein
MEMRYYWIQDRIEEGKFDVSLAPGDTNLGDYFTKRHSRLITSNSVRFVFTAKLTPWSATTPSTLCCEGVLIFALPPRLTTYTYPVWAPIHAIIQGYLCR